MTINKLYHDRGVAMVQAQRFHASSVDNDNKVDALNSGLRIDQELPDGSEVSTRDNFEVFRTDEVQLTSTLFSGGDWHWRLATSAGEVLVEGSGYRTQGQCLEAVALLQCRANSAGLEVAC